MPNLWNITAYPSYCEGAQNTYNKSMVVQNHLTQSLFYNKVQVSHRMKTALKVKNRMIVSVLLACPSDHMADRKPASPKSTVPPTAGLEKAQNSKFQLWFLLNEDYFYTIIKLKNLKSNQCK